MATSEALAYACDTYACDTYVYNKIANIKHNGYDLYYREPIDTQMRKATAMNAKYNYFYKSPYNDTIQTLGQFKGLSKRNSESRAYDYDFDVFEFTEYDYISCSEKNNLYCMGIPEEGASMVRIDSLFYLDSPIYYKKSF